MTATPVRRLPVSAALGVVLLAGCGSSDDGYERLSRVAADPTTSTRLYDGGVWQLELTDDDTCVRLRIVDRASACAPTALGVRDVAVGRIGGGDDPRFVFVVTGLPEVVARRYTDREIGTIVEAQATLPRGGSVVVIELADGEAPQGVQILSGERELIQAISLLD